MSDKDADDPFACFGDDDDDFDDDEVGENGGEWKKIPKSTDLRTNATRDPDCGILAFHRGTEQSLLNHVQLELANLSLDLQLSDQERNPADRSSTVLRIIDDFCMTRHWMMHVGVEKGRIMQEFVNRCCQEQIMDKSSSRPLVVVELGTYCGYSSILLAKTLRDLHVSFQIFSVEVDPQHAQVARELIRLCSLQDHIRVLLLQPAQTTLEKLLKSNFISTSSPTSSSNNTRVTIDLLFIDHDKDLYLADLRHLEEAGLVRKGCFVAADNVIFAKIDEYRDYMKELAEEGIVETRLEESQLEYSEPDTHGLDEAKKQLLRDGVGKYYIALAIPLYLKSSSLLLKGTSPHVQPIFRTFNIPQGPPNRFLRNRLQSMIFMIKLLCELVSYLKHRTLRLSDTVNPGHRRSIINDRHHLTYS
jgi:catechol O-methyltransferase